MYVIGLKIQNVRVTLITLLLKIHREKHSVLRYLKTPTIKSKINKQHSKNMNKDLQNVRLSECLIHFCNFFIFLIIDFCCVKNRTKLKGNYSCLRVNLRFTRDRHFYFTTVFIPGIILVTSSFITFWLEWNAVPARCVTSLRLVLK